MYSSAALLPEMFGLHTMPAFEHGVEKSVSLAVKLSWKQHAASCELCPSLLVTLKLLHSLKRDNSSIELCPR